MTEHGGEFIVPFGSYCWVQKGSNGETKCIVGPKKVSPEAADECVILVKDSKTGRMFFQKTHRDEAIRPNVVIPKGFYAFLFNPATDSHQPDATRGGGEYSATPLDTGNKVIKIGPSSFPLWPGQWIDLVQGHTMQPDEYLVTLIYDAQAAMENMDDEVKAEQDRPTNSEEEIPQDTTEDRIALQEGDRKVIRGDKVKFYIPPTGIRVLPREDGKGFVETACRVGAMEYAHLRKKDGTERYERGPQMVFPEHDELFVRYEFATGDNRIFPVFELTNLSGIHIKINEDYKDEILGKCNEGQEYFVTGNEYPIYVPRPEHEIIKYGKGRIIHHAVLIPEGMARYKAHRINGSIEKVNGPSNHLLDPREWKWVVRALNPKLSQLWYPNSQEAFEHNVALYSASASGGQVDHEQLMAYENNGELTRGLKLSAVAFNGQRDRAFKGKGSKTSRQEEMTALPKPEIIDIMSQTSRYDCAPEICPWTGYAIMVQHYNEETGNVDAKVITGPAKIIMEFTDELAVVQLSTGTPKRHDLTIETVYLQYLNNTVSDMIEVETADFVQMRLHYRMRINFQGNTQEDMKKWFNHTNYIQLVTTEVRSMIKSMAKKLSVQDLYVNASDMIRNLILGDKPEDGAHRNGRLFAENNCLLYDLDLLDCNIVDKNIEKMLLDAQQARVQQIIELRTSQDSLSHLTSLEEIKRHRANELHESTLQTMELRNIVMDKTYLTELEVIERQGAKIAAELDAQLNLDKIRLKVKSQALKTEREVFEADLKELMDKHDHDYNQAKRQVELNIQQLDKQTESFERGATAISTHLTAALTTFSQNELSGKLVDSLNPLAILEGKTLNDIAQGILGDTQAGVAIRKLLKHPEMK